MIDGLSSHVIRDSNNNALVFDTFDKATESNPNAHPLSFLIEVTNTQVVLFTQN